MSMKQLGSFVLIIVFFIAEIFIFSQAMAADTLITVPQGEYLVIPSKYENYGMVSTFVYNGFQVYRSLEHVPGLKLSEGEFIIRLNPDRKPIVNKVLNNFSKDYRKLTLSKVRKWPFYPLRPLKIGIYCGKGVTAGYLWHAYPLEKCQVDVIFFTEKDLEQLKDLDVICFPSGGRYQQNIGHSGQDRLKWLIREQGVGYLGTCGGNVFGCKLDLLDATLIKSKKGFSYGIKINGYPKMEVTEQNHPAMISASRTIRPFYYSGQAFKRVGSDVTVLATYKQFSKCFTFDGIAYHGETHQRMSNQPGIVTGQYGRGRVILSGPHPEVGEEQLFVDWIYYLAGGRIWPGGRNKINLTLKNTNVKKIDSRSFQSLVSHQSLVSQIDEFEKLVRPYDAKIQSYYNQRWKGGITVGLPVLLIFVDTCDRLKQIKKSLSFLDKKNLIAGQMARKLQEICAQYEIRISSARTDFVALIPHLENALKMLEDIDQSPLDTKEILKKNFYQECYEKLIPQMKAINLILVRLDHCLRQIQMILVYQ